MRLRVLEMACHGVPSFIEGATACQMPTSKKQPGSETSAFGLGGGARE